VEGENGEMEGMLAEIKRGTGEILGRKVGQTLEGMERFLWEKTSKIRGQTSDFLLGLIKDKFYDNLN